MAKRTGAAILSVDSMQVYREMDIGTAKPTLRDREEVLHGMIDIADPADDFTVAQFQTSARRFVETTDRPIVIVGGSGLHFRSVVDPLSFPEHDPVLRSELDGQDPAVMVHRLLDIDPAAGDAIDIQNPRRVVRALEIALLTGETPTARTQSADYAAVQAYEAKLPFVGVGLDPENAIEGRITTRTGNMIESGLVGEVERLAGRLGRNAAQAVGYKELLPVVAGQRDLESAISDIHRATVALVKHQRTFFGRDPRIDWIASQSTVEQAVSYCLDVWRPE